MVGEKRIWVGVTKDVSSHPTHVFQFAEDDGAEIAKIKASDDASVFTDDELFVRWDEGEPSTPVEKNIEFKFRHGRYIFNDIAGIHDHIVYAFCEGRNPNCFESNFFDICVYYRTF